MYPKCLAWKLEVVVVRARVKSTKEAIQRQGLWAKPRGEIEQLKLIRLSLQEQCATSATNGELEEDTEIRWI